MHILDNLKTYFYKKSNKVAVGNAPDGVCPNCWGKQEWEGEFQKKIKPKL